MFKRKMIAPFVAILLCVGMVSVGFAAWVITNTDTKNTAGSFDVYEVKNKDITITATMSDAVVKFAGDGDTHTGAWLSFNNNDKQDLTCSLKITIDNWSTLSQDTENVITLQVNGAENMTSNDAVAITNANFTNSNYIVLPGAGEITIEHNGTNWVASMPTTTPTGWVNISEATITGTVTLNMQFAWGSAFNGENPLDYYNAKTYAAESANAQTALGNLYKLNTGAGSDYAIYVKGSVA